jgi:hypothetical protein
LQTKKSLWQHDKNQDGVKLTFFTEKSTETPPISHILNSLCIENVEYWLKDHFHSLRFYHEIQDGVIFAAEEKKMYGTLC